MNIRIDTRKMDPAWSDLCRIESTGRPFPRGESTACGFRSYNHRATSSAGAMLVRRGLVVRDGSMFTDRHPFRNEGKVRVARYKLSDEGKTLLAGYRANGQLVTFNAGPTDTVPVFSL